MADDPALQDKGYEIGESLLAYVAPAAAEIGCVYLDWLPHMDDPSVTYPTNPYVDCPALGMRLATSNLMSSEAPKTITAGSSFGHTYVWELWLYLRQIRGQRHHPLLIQAMAKIRNRFLANRLNTAYLPAVPGWKWSTLIPDLAVFHNEIKHPKWDDPDLRVSVASLQLNGNGQITICVPT